MPVHTSTHLHLAGRFCIGDLTSIVPVSQFGTNRTSGSFWHEQRQVRGIVESNSVSPTIWHKSHLATDSRPGQRQVRGIVESNLVRLFRLQFSRVEASSSLTDAGRTTKFAPVKSLWFSGLILGILLFEFRFTVFFPLGCGVDSWIPPIQFFQIAKGKAPKEAWGGHLSGWGINETFLRPHERNALCCSESDWSKLCNVHPIFCCPLSTILHPVLASSFPFHCDKISRKGQFFRSFVWIGFYKKDVWGVVKSWEFEGNLSYSKILRIQRKNPMKWVLSISRDYWVYLHITLQSFKIWEFWGEFWGIETFHQSKFSPASVRVVPSRIPNLERKCGQYHDFGFVRAKRQRNVASKSRNLRNVWKEPCTGCEFVTFVTFLRFFDIFRFC